MADGRRKLIVPELLAAAKKREPADPPRPLEVLDLTDTHHMTMDPETGRKMLVREPRPFTPEQVEVEMARFTAWQARTFNYFATTNAMLLELARLLRQPPAKTPDTFEIERLRKNILVGRGITRSLNRLCEIARSSQPPAERETPWQPIATAPKDEPVVTYRGARLIAVAERIDHPADLGKKKQREIWCCTDGCELLNVTHWMPLPPAPTEALERVTSDAASSASQPHVLTADDLAHGFTKE